MPTLQAFVFDMDGVILDNTLMQARAFQLLFRDLDVEADAYQLLRRLNGMPATDILEQVLEEPASEKDLKKYADQREFLYRTLYRDERRPMAGLVEFLEAARAAGFKIGLGTGSANDTLSYILDYLDLRRFFDVIVGADDVDSGKPHPETYDAVAKKLGIEPENCLVFEDALLGEQAAYKAGMRCVAITSTLSGAEFQAPLAVARDFTGITPEQLREQFAKAGAVPAPNEEFTKQQYPKEEKAA
jgi:beta-phosphoglucomutase family hydrolase